MKRYTYVIVLLLLIIGLSILVPLPIRENYVDDVCPLLNMSLPNTPSCLQMLYEKNSLDETSIQDHYGHDKAHEILSGIDNLRFTTADKDRVYGTGKCIIPPSMKSTLGLDSSCRGTNSKGVTVQLKTMPRECPHIDYTDTELAPNYDGCVLEEDNIRQFIPFAADILQQKKDETVSTEVAENDQRRAVNQQLQEERIRTDQQTEGIIQEGQNQYQSAMFADASTSSLASTEQHYNAAATTNANAASSYNQHSQNAVNANPHLFGSTPAPVIGPPAPAPGSWKNMYSKHRHNFCLDVPGGTHNNAQMIMWNCHSGGNQKFSRVGDSIRIQHSGKCLHAEGSGNGARVLQAPCDGSANQQWTMDGSSRLVARNSGRCLDISGGRTNNGAPLIVWDCHGGNNQKWRH